MAFDPVTDYPLGSRRPDLVETPSGVPLREVTLASARAGTLAAADIRATPATLRRQAAVARAAGRAQLADNLERAAELASVPDDELLEVSRGLTPEPRRRRRGASPRWRRPSAWRATRR